MEHGMEAHIILDQSLTRGKPALIELQALASRAVVLLACKPETVTARIFKKPQSKHIWVSLTDSKRHLMSLVKLQAQRPVVDYEVIGQTAGAG